MISAEHLIFIVIGALVVIGILVYLVFLIFLPEWVGVTGKVAREAERAHREIQLEEDQGDDGSPDEATHKVQDPPTE